MSYVNAGDETLVFRDDSGKRWVAAGEPFEIVGPQHAARIAAMEGVEQVSTEPPAPDTRAPLTVAQLHDRLAELGVPVPPKAHRAVLEAAYFTATAAQGAPAPDAAPDAAVEPGTEGTRA